ncbi:hypothetical protein VRU48_11065 [Pedobacter sp. KR3-3]|uniref:DoxX family protein n=1 Tax=Pedobacter albus TaxID=3113905 RepID=A0ABU7I846_9SPHI|nr:hypothetical protein [Pedobacter sp. KR3-3]MEE1945647.1 hypothetical protein [Pedobacter sp. KR3-3]
MKPLFVLIGVFIISLFVTRYATGTYNFALSGSIAMAAMLVFTTIGHFAFPKGMALMVPNFVPFKTGMVYLTGLLELAFAIGLLLKDWRIDTAWALLVFLAIMLPANIKTALQHIDYQKGTFDGPGPKYLWFRIPLQLFFMAWVYFFCIAL